MIPDVGSVTDGVDAPVRVAGGDQLDHHPGVGELARATGMPQPGQHRQAHRPRQKRQDNNNATTTPATTQQLPNPIGLGPFAAPS
jgi:hypothetical protein